MTDDSIRLVKRSTPTVPVYPSPVESRRVSERDTEGAINSRFAGSSITPIKTLGGGKSRSSALIGQFSPLNVQFITIFGIFRQRRPRKEGRKPLPRV